MDQQSIQLQCAQKQYDAAVTQNAQDKQRISLEIEKQLGFSKAAEIFKTSCGDIPSVIKLKMENSQMSEIIR